MNLKELVRAEKTDITLGDWKKGRIPRGEFPLSKARAKDYKFGPAYDWCIIKFKALGGDCRVRVLIREGREIYYATLGLCDDGDTRILASLEFHGTEPGWHVHAKCSDFQAIGPGQNRQDSRRFPYGGHFHRNNKFGVTKETAKQKAIAFFRIWSRGSLL